jgi:single-strand DNA-binding protein
MTPQGKPVVKFSLAVDQGKNQPPMWLNIVAWDKLAEIVEKYAEKGMQVFVAGRLQTRTYDDKSGSKRQSIDLIASTVQLLDKRESGTTRQTQTADAADVFGEEDFPF